METSDRRNSDHDRVSTGEESSFDRRSFLWASPSLMWGISVSSSVLVGSSLPATAAVTEKSASTRGNQNDGSQRVGEFVLADSILQSLTFERILGSGSYKTVYLVSATIPSPGGDGDTAGSMRNVRYALAVERLRNKREVKNAFRGVRIPELIQQGLKDDANGDGKLFETIVDWWIQSSDVQEYAPGKRVFAATNGAPVVNIDKTLGRTRSKPKKNFVGSRWMLSFKPVYETDLKRFIRKAPMLFPVGKLDADETKTVQGKISRGDELLAPLSYYWTEPVLMAFVLEILHAGKLMHEAGIVHRDIKPKNMMIYSLPSSSGSSIKRPVIIDYGYSEVGNPVVLEAQGPGSARKEICVGQPGQLKGEAEYVLYRDLAKYQGCQRGDAYAMGKTLYEFVFGSVDLQQQQQPPNQDASVLSMEGAEVQNQLFRNLLFDTATAGTESRFRLSHDAAECLLSIVRGLCGPLQDETNTLSFADAETILSNFLSPSSSPSPSPLPL